MAGKDINNRIFDEEDPTLDLDIKTEIRFSKKNLPKGEMVPVFVDGKKEYVLIPLDAKDGTILTVSGRGKYNPRSGKTGDLYVLVHIIDEQQFLWKIVIVAAVATAALISIALLLSKKPTSESNPTTKSTEVSCSYTTTWNEPIYATEASTEKDKPTVPQMEKKVPTAPELGMIDAGNYHSVYLRPDGTVSASGKDELSEHANKSNRLDVDAWTEIIEVSASSHTVGLRSDGTVEAVGVNEYGQCNVSRWINIVAVCAGDNNTVGIKDDGTVVVAGRNDLGQCDTYDWRKVTQVTAGAETVYGLRENGTVVAAGGNRSGQRDVSSWSKIKAISAGIYYVVGIKEDGTIISTGISEKWKNQYSTWSNVEAVSAGSTHMVALLSDGTVRACGSNDRGQCNVQGWTDIIAISVGMYHTVGLKEDGTLVTTGSNAYGQLDIVNVAWYDGENSQIVFEKEDDANDKAVVDDGKLQYPISEEDCYIIYKNYFGYEMAEGDSMDVVVERSGSGTKEMLMFAIYRINPNTGGYNMAGLFVVYVNTGVCERGDVVFQAEDYFY